MALSVLILYRVPLVARSQSLGRCVWIFLFVYSAWDICWVDGRWFGLRLHMGSLRFPLFWSGGGRLRFSHAPVTIAVYMGIISILNFRLSCIFGKELFCYFCLWAVFPFILPVLHCFFFYLVDKRVLLPGL